MKNPVIPMQVGMTVWWFSNQLMTRAYSAGGRACGFGGVAGRGVERKV